jgi:hypothetical protein
MLNMPLAIVLSVTAVSAAVNQSGGKDWRDVNYGGAPIKTAPATRETSSVATTPKSTAKPAPTTVVKTAPVQIANAGDWFNGVVTREVNQGAFEMKADDGRVFRVGLKPGQPRTMKVGERVRTRGTFKGDVLLADQVEMTSAQTQTTKTTSVPKTPASTATSPAVSKDWRDVDFSGTLVQVVNANKLVVKAADGNNFVVEVEGNAAASLQKGAAVQVIGKARFATVKATSVRAAK